MHRRRIPRGPRRHARGQASLSAQARKRLRHLRIRSLGHAGLCRCFERPCQHGATGRDLAWPIGGSARPMATNFHGALSRGSRLRRTTMRRLRALLLGLTILTGAGALPAGAQMAVIDHSNLAQTTLAAQRALSELQQLTAQYDQLVTTYQMLTNPTDILSMVPGLSAPNVQNPLPALTLLNGLVAGQTAVSGAGV